MCICMTGSVTSIVVERGRVLVKERERIERETERE